MSDRPDYGWDDHPVEPDYGGTSWRGHLYKALISVGVLTAFGAAVLYAYSMGGPSGDAARKPDDVPLVKAEAKPVKVRPADPGGEKVPHRNRRLYRDLDIAPPKGDQARRPPAAKPDRRQARAQTYEDILAPKSTIKPPVEPSRTETKGAKTQRAEIKRAETKPPIPKRLDDKPSPRGGQVAMLPSLRRRDADRPKAAPERRPQVAARSPHASTRVRPMARPRHRSTERDRRPDRRRRADTATVQTASLAGRYRVQLGAFRSSEKARHEWRALVRSNKDVLGALSMTIERVDLGPKGVFYRLQAGPLKNEPAARGLCRKLGRRRVDCIFVNG
jgi:hypothetical protein